MNIEPPWGDFDPMNLFVDITYIFTEDDKRKIERQCLAHGYIAFIDWDGQKDCWVFHTLHTPGGLKSEKPILARQFDPPTLTQREKALEDKLLQRLRESGQTVATQVVCPAGIVDVLTDDALYEIKEPLTRHNLFYAIGQVLRYRRAVNPSLRAVIVFQSRANNVDQLLAYAQGLGVEVMQWAD